jgi:hypothetical protein
MRAPQRDRQRVHERHRRRSSIRVTRAPPQSS